MLAAQDPHNPAALAPLAALSITLYPAFLERIAALSGTYVPFQTDTTIQYKTDGGLRILKEHSLDPRQLAHALIAAVRSTSIRLVEHTGSLELSDSPEAVHVRDSMANHYRAAVCVYANGAWFRGQHAVVPRKGQMLRVQLASPLNQVHRSEHVYIVPRTSGPQAGTALIGATVEDAGFDTSTHAADLAHLHALAADLVPGISSAATIEAWAGIRPGTADGLPILGPVPFAPREIAATGHFRNGILLAPATAHVLADTIEGKATLDLAAFAPSRFNR